MCRIEDLFPTLDTGVFIFYLSFRRVHNRLKKKKAAPISFLRTIDTALGFTLLSRFYFF
jgi:hypothetical protein